MLDGCMMSYINPNPLHQEQDSEAEEHSLAGEGIIMCSLVHMMSNLLSSSPSFLHT